MIKKKGLRKYNFARTAHFFVHFSVVALPDYNVKLPEISHLQVLLRKYVCIPVHLFFHCRPFSPWCMAGSISHFLTAAVTFSCFSTNGIGLLCCFLFLALSSFSLFHVNVDIWIWSKERLGFVVVSYSLKVRVAMRFTAKNVLCRSLSRCSSPKLSLPHVIFTLLSFVDITGNDFAIKLQI